MSLRPNILWKVFGFLVFLVFSKFFGFPHGFSPKEKSNSWLVPSKPRENQKNQKTKTFQRMFGLRLMFGFFLVFLEFFLFFFLVMTLKKLKKTQGFFGFLKELLLEVRQKTKKKLSSFLVFFAWIVVTCPSRNLSKNQKRPEFFWLFALLQVRVPSKNQKTLSFLVFSRSWPKKNTKKTRGKPKKKPNMSLRPNILWKVLVFWFFGFLEVFWFSPWLLS